MTNTLFNATGLFPIVLATLSLCNFWVEHASAQEIELLNVSYDPTRELYRDINEAFDRDYFKREKMHVVVRQSHGGSSSQARGRKPGRASISRARTGSAFRRNSRAFRSATRTTARCWSGVMRVATRNAS